MKFIKQVESTQVKHSIVFLQTVQKELYAFKTGDSYRKEGVAIYPSNTLYLLPPKIFPCLTSPGEMTAEIATITGYMALSLLFPLRQKKTDCHKVIGSF